MDISEHGASFILNTTEAKLTKKGDVLEVSVGDGIAGRAEVRSTVDLGDGQIRIGCSMLWEETDWIESINRMSKKLEKKQRKAAQIIPQGLFN